LCLSSFESDEELEELLFEFSFEFEFEFELEFEFAFVALKFSLRLALLLPGIEMYPVENSTTQTIAITIKPRQPTPPQPMAIFVFRSMFTSFCVKQTVSLRGVEHFNRRKLTVCFTKSYERVCIH
jgi:hypothetical protein